MRDEVGREVLENTREVLGRTVGLKLGPEHLAIGL